MTTKKLTVVAVVGGMLFILLESLVPDGQYKVAMEVIFFIAVCVFSAYVGRQAYTARKSRDATNEKTEIVKSTREESLSKTETIFLRKKMNRRMAAVIGTFLFIYCIYLLIANFFLPHLFGQFGEYLFWILSGGIFFVAVYLFGKRIHKLRQDLRGGKKLVVVGNVSHWEHYQYNDNDYVLYVDEIGIRVKSAIFEKYAKGDAIEVHLFAPWQNTLLFEKKIEKRL